MVLRTWNDCKYQGFTKEISIDNDLISSLIIASKNKQLSESLLPLNKITSSSKISLAYDSLRILLESLSISKGYKIYNHECYFAFINSILNKPELANEFNRIRKIRNSINYYGFELVLNKVENLLSDIYSLIKSLNN